ncbi:unnamed protein product [Schistosoma margrebowiei]|uniref:methylated diphthine methylhydrolase n=1 Tax=Schistosoma margrebowiei TaxID=48269 RepID=A0A183MNC0_9TREM|nr:unnamed protein product [Schistosoma margrebowiei]
MWLLHLFDHDLCLLRSKSSANHSELRYATNNPTSCCFHSGLQSTSSHVPESCATVSTARIVKDTQERFGGLLLFSRVSTDYQYVLSSNISCSGVLDISWLNGNVAIGALANGSTKLWNCTVDGPSLNELTDFPVSDHILLSVDTSSDRFVFSDSGGNISVWKIDTSSCSNPQSINKWHGHEFEAWCACLNKWNSEIVFTGSDDSKCCVWDLREGCKKPLNIIR